MIFGTKDIIKIFYSWFHDDNANVINCVFFLWWFYLFCECWIELWQNCSSFGPPQPLKDSTAWSRWWLHFCSFGGWDWSGWLWWPSALGSQVAEVVVWRDKGSQRKRIFYKLFNLTTIWRWKSLCRCYQMWHWDGAVRSLDRCSDRDHW